VAQEFTGEGSLAYDFIIPLGPFTSPSLITVLLLLLPELDREELRGGQWFGAFILL
jgi:hypothetical protein